MSYKGSSGGNGSGCGSIVLLFITIVVWIVMIPFGAFGLAFAIAFSLLMLAAIGAKVRN